MNEKIKWTNLTQQEIVEGLKVHGITVSVTVVQKLLKPTFRIPNWHIRELSSSKSIFRENSE